MIYQFLRILAFSIPVFAHPGIFEHSHRSLLWQGIVHPLSGLDHLLAALAVGVWSASLDSELKWALPFPFLIGISLGANAAVSGHFLPEFESGIIFSLGLLGLALLSNLKLSVRLVIPVFLIFGFFHGNAHGIEVPDPSQAGSYFFGLLISTAFLHALGVISAHRILTFRMPFLLRFFGAGIALSAALMA